MKINRLVLASLFAFLLILQSCGLKTPPRPPEKKGDTPSNKAGQQY